MSALGLTFHPAGAFCATHAASFQATGSKTLERLTVAERDSISTRRVAETRHFGRHEAPFELNVAALARQSSFTVSTKTSSLPEDSKCSQPIYGSPGEAAAPSMTSAGPVESAQIDQRSQQAQIDLEDSLPADSAGLLPSLTTAGHSGDSRPDEDSAVASHAPAQIIRPQPIRSVPCSPPLSPDGHQDSGLTVAVSKASSAAGPAATLPAALSSSPPPLAACSSSSADVRVSSPEQWQHLVESGASDGEIAALKLQQLAVELQRHHSALQQPIPLSAPTSVGGPTGAFQHHPLRKQLQHQQQQCPPNPSQVPSKAQGKAAVHAFSSNMQLHQYQEGLPIPSQLPPKTQGKSSTHTISSGAHQVPQFDQQNTLQQQQPRLQTQEMQQEQCRKAQEQHAGQRYASDPSGSIGNHAAFTSGVTNSYSYKTAFPFPSGLAATFGMDEQAIGTNLPILPSDRGALGGPNLSGILPQVPAQQQSSQFHQHLQPPHYQLYQQYNYQPQQQLPPQSSHNSTPSDNFQHNFQLNLMQEHIRQAQLAGTAALMSCRDVAAPCSAPFSLPLPPPGVNMAIAPFGPGSWRACSTFSPLSDPGNSTGISSHQLPQSLPYGDPALEMPPRMYSAPMPCPLQHLHATLPTSYGRRSGSSPKRRAYAESYSAAKSAHTSTKFSPHTRAVCALCGEVDTPTWRRFEGQLMCNACGLRRTRAAAKARGLPAGSRSSSPDAHKAMPRQVAQRPASDASVAAPATGLTAASNSSPAVAEAVASSAHSPATSVQQAASSTHPPAARQ